MRILFFSLEFSEPIFSGNGTYSRSLVRSMLQLGAQVTVVCAGADDEGLDARIDRTLAAFESFDAFFQLRVVSVSDWSRRLDRRSCWKQFGTSIASDSLLLNECALFDADVLIAVDWSCLAAVQALNQHLGELLPATLYLNFRVFHCNSSLSTDDREFYENMEKLMLQQCRSALALCDHDRTALSRLVPRCDVSVLNPPLRSEVMRIAEAKPTTTSRIYLTCCCRLSPEKNTSFFVDIVEASADLLSELGIVPFLCSSASDPEYGDRLKARLRRVAPDCIIRDFIGVNELFEVFSRTKLNIHPATYEAYGMTIMEAAAAGAPSLVHHQNIGACDRLSSACPDESAVVTVDMTRLDAATGVVRSLLGAEGALEATGRAARRCALQWGEEHSARRLMDVLRHLRTQTRRRSPIIRS